MVYVESLGRLVCGNCDGEVKVVSDGGVKNSLTLFKCAVRSMIVIDKPDVQRSVPQQAKVKALHKYELNSLDSPIMYKQSEKYAH
jgi:acylphosphatase